MFTAALTGLARVSRRWSVRRWQHQFPASGRPVGDNLKNDDNSFKVSTFNLLEGRGMLHYQYVIRPPSPSGAYSLCPAICTEVYNLRTSRRFEASEWRDLLLDRSVEFLKKTSPNAVPAVQLCLAYNWLLIMMEVGDSKPITMFLRNVVSRLLSEHEVGTMTAHELVVAIFVAGELRYFPSRDHRQKGTRRLPLYLEDALMEGIKSLQTDEVGIVALAFYRQNFVLSSDNYRLKNELFFRLRSVDVHRLAEFDHAIRSVSKLLRKRSAFDDDRVRTVVEKYAPVVSQLSLSARIGLFSLVATRMDFQGQEAAWTFVDSVVRSVVPTSLGQCSIKIMQRLAFALMWIKYDDAETFNELLRAAGKADSSGPRSGSSFVLLNGFAAMAGHYDASNLERIFNAANQWFRDDDEDLDDLMRSGKALLGGDGVHRCELVLRDRLHSFVAIGKLDCFLDVNFPDYDGPRLRPAVRNALLRIVDYLRDYLRDDLRDYPSSAASILRDVELDLKACLRSHDLVRCGKLLPYEASDDLVFAMDEESKVAVPLPDEFRLSNERSTTFRPSDVADGRRRLCAVLVPKKKEFGPGLEPSGVLAFKKAQLEKLGYEVMTVKTLLYQWAVKDDQGKKFISDMLEANFSWRGAG